MISLKKLMRYNDFENDPLSYNNSCNTIAARGDLIQDEKEKECFGAIDVKFVSIKEILDTTYEELFKETVKQENPEDE